MGQADILTDIHIKKRNKSLNLLYILYLLIIQ